MDQPARAPHFGRMLASAFVLSLVLGFTTLAVWLLVGRRAFQGGIAHAIADNGWVLFGLLALAWFATGLVAGASARRGWSRTDLAVMALLAWFAQGLIVVLYGQIYGDELRFVLLAGAVWLTAMGIVLQPAAVFVGAIVGKKWELSRAERTSSNDGT